MDETPKPRKIVVVDDSETARKIMLRCLNALGYGDAEFREADNGALALEMIRDDPPDLIITDLNMPVMDGVSMLRRIKGSFSLTDIPVIVVSSLLGDAQRTQLRERGVEYLVGKPVDPQELREVMQRIAEEMDRCSSQ